MIDLCVEIVYKVLRGRSPKESEKIVPDHRNSFGVHEDVKIRSERPGHPYRPSYGHRPMVHHMDGGSNPFRMDPRRDIITSVRSISHDG